MWKLPGIEECGEESVIVHSSHGQLVEWNGLKLHIHEGSLPEGVHQCKIYIKASLAGQYEIPENSHLVQGRIQGGFGGFGRTPLPWLARVLIGFDCGLYGTSLPS